jgi:hypothetical protein
MFPLIAHRRVGLDEYQCTSCVVLSGRIEKPSLDLITGLPEGWTVIWVAVLLLRWDFAVSWKDGGFILHLLLDSC